MSPCCSICWCAGAHAPLALQGRNSTVCPRACFRRSHSGRRVDRRGRSRLRGTRAGPSRAWSLRAVIQPLLGLGSGGGADGRPPTSTRRATAGRLPGRCSRAGRSLFQIEYITGQFSIRQSPSLGEKDVGGGQGWCFGCGGCNIKMKKQESRILESIIVLQRKHYGCLAKVFCCKCVHCCQDFDFSLLTSENRKSAFQRMITRYIKGLHANKGLSVIMDPFFILVALLLGEDSDIYAQLMAIVNSQSEPAVFSKEDLQFYIPQLCTYLVFHEELKNMQLQKLLVRACKVDIHFSLKYYFYMKSLEIMQVGDTEIRKFQRVSQYNAQFRTMISNYYHPQRFRDPALQERERERGSAEDLEDKLRATCPAMTHSLALSKKSESELFESSISEHKRQEDEGPNQDRSIKQKFKVNKLRYLQQSNVYEPLIKGQGTLPQGLFESTINFFSDLVELSKRLVQVEGGSRREQLMRNLQQVNRRLPATIYIPFTKSSYQDLNIINIVASQARVFSTKERAPYYICLESFLNPTYNEGISKDKKIRSFTQMKIKNMKKTDILQEDCVSDVEDLRESQISINLQVEKEKGRQKEKQKQKEKQGEDNMRNSNHSSQKESRGKKRSWSSLFKLTKQIKKKILNEKTQNQGSSSQEQQSEVKTEQQTHGLVGEAQGSSSADSIFGKSQAEQYQKISQISPYSNLPGYKLIHVIIKSYDDLRQESFAMQLLQEFDKIFKIERLQVKLLPYEVLPLSHQAGIMECVRDAITIDELKRKGKTLLELLDSKAKRRNFIHTLTAYSLVTYFLQVKDRHNGNIMIRKDGSIFHIDYGFFMSNLPGKGVELEKNLPFKLTNEYVDALGGLKSHHFQQFRKLFYQAFNSCRKHQHRILILTKLMYSSYGKTMPCFAKGDQAIDQLQKRFNPRGVTNDAEISVYCQNLINSSIDNWRSRWYDKWQYYVQGIFY